MASYNVDRDFDSLRQEAINRVRRMQNQSRSLVEPSESPSASPSDPPPVQEDPIAETKNPEPVKEEKEPSKKNDGNILNQLLGSLFPANKSSKSSDGSLTKLIDSLHLDEEKILIGLLIYILAKNGGDVKLLIGLGYLIL